MSELLPFILAQEDFRKARLPSLYSNFVTLQTVNPGGYTANTTAWKSVLAKASYAGVIPSASSAATSTDRLILPITTALLPSLTTREYGTPMALGCAINDGVATGEFIQLKSFLTKDASIYYKPWVDPWKVVSWGLRQIGVGGGGADGGGGGGAGGRGVGDGKLANGEFVVVKNVEEVSRRVLRAVARSTKEIERVMTLETLEHGLADVLKDPPLSERDFKVLIKHLTRDLGEASVEGKTIKFKSPDAPLTPITQTDITTAQLKHLILTQEMKSDALAAKISSLQKKAKTAALANNKITALSALRSKKMTEQHLQAVTNSLSSLESVLVKIEQAADNIALLETLEQGSKVLNQLNKETGGIERVEKVMDQLQERMEETDEISRIVVEPGATKMDEVEGDVQEEFEKLLMEEGAKQARAEEERKRKEEEEEAKALEERLAGLSVSDAQPVGAEEEARQKIAAL
ncbi:hypothetical protein DRE_00740 [Drechslerella stenobrocha 248]|uniref:Uncharacterized protein n=1 Tax=Drechslerella stenobrocha 248 TaxID=1043628 RepID=W7HMU2_9PEZI|nr:hypothetical protein DRE_00740 [Drechslerella stenobrocha 248]